VQVFQADDLGLGKRLVAEIGQRRTLPQRQRLPQRSGCLISGPCGQSFTALRDQLLELADVQLLREDPQRITRSLGNEATWRKHPSQS
jgi:hypothetical protein